MVALPPGYKFYHALITEVALRYRLDPFLVLALVWQESAFNADAFRYEPAFWNRYLKKNPLYAALNPRRVSSSYGLCQVMYCRIFEDRLVDNDALPPEHLFIPEPNLTTGCQLLVELFAWAGEYTDDPARIQLSALAAYNGGRGGNRPTEDPLRNGVYARSVLAKHALLVAE